jgi:hypothetical protein
MQELYSIKICFLLLICHYFCNLANITSNLMKNNAYIVLFLSLVLHVWLFRWAMYFGFSGHIKIGPQHVNLFGGIIGCFT